MFDKRCRCREFSVEYQLSMDVVHSWGFLQLAHVLYKFDICSEYSFIRELFSTCRAVQRNHFLPAFFLRAWPLAIPAALARSLRCRGVSLPDATRPPLPPIFLRASRSASVSFCIAPLWGYALSSSTNSGFTRTDLMRFCYSGRPGRGVHHRHKRLGESQQCPAPVYGVVIVQTCRRLM